MTQLLVWHETATKFYQSGISKVVLYVQDATALYPLGVAWQGVNAISEKPSGAEVTKKYADNVEYLALIADEVFAATIEAMMYPDEFEVCDGSIEPTPGVSVGQQGRSKFGLCYRTEHGNDVDGLDKGYKLHMIYGLLAAPTERANASINESPETMSLSWELTSSPVATPGYKPTSHVVIDSISSPATELAALEAILYGVDDTVDIDARLPLPAELITLMTVI